MSLRVLYFFPTNLYRALNGAHLRGLETLAALAALGCEITLFSSVTSAESPWDTKPGGTLPGPTCNAFVLHRPSWGEGAYLGMAKRIYWLLTRLRLPGVRKLQAYSLRSGALCSRSMRRQFEEVVAKTQPDVLFMNYAHWDSLIDHKRHGQRRRIIDTIDLVSVSMRLWAAVEAHLPPGPVDPTALPDALLREDFLDSHSAPGPDVQQECDIYDQYDVSIAITRKEADVIQQHTRRTRVVTLPMTRSPRSLNNTHSGPAVFSAGRNPFNVQGYAYFARKVLPLVRWRAPDFTLAVTGQVCSRLLHQNGMELHGILDTLESIYRDACFAVNPVLAGTGQQVKILDAMAHGLPVIALDRIAEGTPLRHGVNGLIASNAAEFANHVLTLWTDRALCHRLGTAARETVAAECSPEMLRQRLHELLGPQTSLRM